jgi:hypothetical protein
LAAVAIEATTGWRWVAPLIVRKLGDHGNAVAAAYAELPEIPHGDEYDWSARQAQERRKRECFALTEEGADAARAFG